MADITVTCQNCKKEAVVSEYAAPESVFCRSCGARLRLPRVSKQSIKLSDSLYKGQGPEPPPQDAPPSDDPKASPRKAMTERFERVRRRDRKKKKPTLLRLVAAWVLFVALTVALVVVRYKRGIFPPETAILMKNCGIGAVLFMLLYSATLAFKDDFFQGMLCLVVPGYTLYFLFVLSDAIFVRAIMAALAMAFGWDTFVFVRDHVIAFYVFAKDWLDKGGGA